MFLLIFSPIKKSVLNLWSRIIIVLWSSFDLHSWFKNGKCRTTMEQRRKPLDLIWLRGHATNTKMQMFLSLTRDTGGHMRKHLKGIALLFLSLSPCLHAIIFHSQSRPFPYVGDLMLGNPRHPLTSIFCEETCEETCFNYLKQHDIYMPTCF